MSVRYAAGRLSTMESPSLFSQTLPSFDEFDSSAFLNSDAEPSSDLNNALSSPPVVSPGSSVLTGLQHEMVCIFTVQSAHLDGK